LTIAIISVRELAGRTNRQTRPQAKSVVNGSPITEPATIPMSPRPHHVENPNMY
jgi:hypothetical protein